MALLIQAPRALLRSWLGRLAALIACWWTAGLATAAENPAFSEYQLKAVFLYNFAHFVEWPSQAFPEPHAPLVIGVLGEDPFGRFLDEVVAGEKVNDHSLSVRRFRRLEEIDRCHVLFVSQSETDRLGEIFERLKSRSILIVGESEGFSLRGGMVRFVTEKNKVRLRINLEAARAAGLIISSKLLRPAEIVTTQKN
ncbi:MAG TPA: YfiR family protein [Opitutaceae bacterium]|nr:YfiR family protein [Opitutaceae bacterium]